MPLLDPEVSGKLGTLQSLDDAITFRAGRLQRPARTARAEHALDHYLLEVYKARYAGARAEAIADMDLADIGTLTQAGGIPSAATALSAPSPRACGKPPRAARS